MTTPTTPTQDAINKIKSAGSLEAALAIAEDIHTNGNKLTTPTLNALIAATLSHVPAPADAASEKQASYAVYCRNNAATDGIVEIISHRTMRDKMTPAKTWAIVAIFAEVASTVSAREIIDTPSRTMRTAIQPRVGEIMAIIG